MVDVGLLAQVYANLFSNAAKYTRESIDHRGQARKAVAYGREIVDDFQRAGKKGIKFNVFTTGPSMSVEQGNRLFQEGIRGDDNLHIPGTGHGLTFVRLVVEMHGGSVGYEPTPEGNNFYFILPLPALDYPLAPYNAAE
jgi:signal transduction histidine kinase